LEQAVASRVICFICLTFLALALAGCGRRGALDPPPGVPADQSAGSVNTQSTISGDVNPSASQAPTTGSNANPPTSKGSSFFLDPLVK
jgi:predicted small lipoprotein YifL